MASMLDTGTKPLLVYNPDHSLHDGRMNENAGRVRAAVEALRSSGRWEQCEILTTLVPSPTEDVAAVLHTAHHLASLRAAFGQASGWFCAVCTLENVEGATGCAVCGTERAAPGGAAEGSVEFIIPEGKTSVYLCARSLDVALTNCALAVEACRRVRASHSPAFALVRPPGHHASSETFGSYCLLNTVGVAAKAMLSGGVCRRVMIIDWDVHHGDGTQAAVLGDETLRGGCTFVSIHRHDREFWPKSGCVGEGSSSGDDRAVVVNVPLRGTGFGDADYFRVFERVVLPLAAATRPDLVLVSAGYDCAKGDLLGRFEVTSAGFCALTRLVLGMPSGGAAVLVLEGGYDVDGDSGHAPLVGGVCASVDGLLAGPLHMDDIDGLEPGWRDQVKPETEAVSDEVLAALPPGLLLPPPPPSSVS